MGSCITTEQLNILLALLTVLLAALTLLLAWVTYKLGQRTLSYMEDRDLELDTRNGWIEIHKAMINLRTQGAFVRLGGFGPFGGNADEIIGTYTLARTQLLGQLDRLNDDPLLLQISEFMNANLLTRDWETDEFEKAFDGFVQQVAFKSRPK